MLNTENISIIANLAGLFGTILIFHFGIPNQIDTDGKQSLLLEGEDLEEKNKIKKYRFLSKVGLLLIGFSFLLPISSPAINSAIKLLQNYFF